MMPLHVLCCVLAASGQAPLDWIVQSVPAATTTKTGMPGDPVNLVLIGSRAELSGAFWAAGWSIADPITARTALRISASVALNRPYPSAPVSDLYLFGRPQDLAFELPVGPSARMRHHVRFWHAGTAPDGQAIWVGSGTFDLRVGRSPATGRLTHRISPDVDTERETILTALKQAGRLSSVLQWPGRGATIGHNGEGDCYYTDGAVGIGVLAEVADQPVECGTWRWARRALRR